MADAGAVAPRFHPRHDRFAISEALGGGALPATVGTCLACAALHGDLLSIQAALRDSWVPRRPRDLRLSRADIARLRPALWRRLVAGFASSRDAITRPLAVGLTSLGIAGLVVANAHSNVIGVSRAAPAASPPETTMAVQAPLGEPPIDQERGPTAPEPDPLAIGSAASMVVGGTLLILRASSVRARAMR